MFGPRLASPRLKQTRNGSPPNSKAAKIDLSESESDDFGLAAPQGPSGLSVGGAAPPADRHDIDLGSSSGSDTEPQPAASAPAKQPLPRAEEASSGSDSESDDYGPSLPNAPSATPKATFGPSMPPSEPAPQRDSWMLAPPASHGFTERDPTRIRARKFASKPTPGGGSGGPSSVWTETPEEKLRRLQDSVLGRKGSGEGDDAAAADSATRSARRTKDQQQRDRAIQASIDAQRGKSLYEEHQARRGKAGGQNEDEDDDPSKRAFDREKDMALGGRIGTAQRRELMNKAANFGSRFQKGSYL